MKGQEFACRLLLHSALGAAAKSISGCVLLSARRVGCGGRGGEMTYRELSAGQAGRAG
jgi:hypothetical protein